MTTPTPTPEGITPAPIDVDDMAQRLYVTYANNNDRIDVWALVARAAAVYLQRGDALPEPNDPWDLTRDEPDAYADWKYEARNGDTLLGFSEWLAVKTSEGV